MKSLVIALICSAISYMAIGQNVGIGTPTPHASAQLDVSSTTRGLLAPRMTTAQRNAIVNPAKGLLVYDTQENSLFHYNGSAWSAVGNGGAATPKVAFGMTGVHGSHLTVPHNSGRRVQYVGSDLYDLAQSYTLLVNTYDPTTSSTYRIPVNGVYHFDLAVMIINEGGISANFSFAELTLRRNRNGAITTIATKKVRIAGKTASTTEDTYMLIDISRDFSLLAGDRIFAEIYQFNGDSKSFTISQTDSYFTGHLVTTF